MQDANSIILRMKEDLKNPANKIEGSFAADNIQAVGKEFEVFYAYLNYINDQHFLDTVEGDFLDLKAADYNMLRKQATKATGILVFRGAEGTNIPKGTIAESDNNAYKTLEDGIINSGVARVRAESLKSGTNGNVPENVIKSLRYRIDGVNSVINEEEFSGGTNIETDESFRERLYIKVRTPATSGNKWHYLNWALSVDGVGRAKVFPLWNGNGTVKVSIIDANNEPANEDLITKVRDYIDPLPGRGEGQAPIGATLTVTTAEVKTVDVNIEVSTDNGFIVENEIKSALDDYFKDIAYTDITRVSYASVTNKLYELDCVKDIYQLKINGTEDAIHVGEEEILKLGIVKVNII